MSAGRRDLDVNGPLTPDRHVRRRVQAYCRCRPDLPLHSEEIRDVKRVDGEIWVFTDSLDHRCPQLFLLRRQGTGSGRDVVPYFAVRERPDRQIVSYSLGKGLCNLAEVKELFGSLYSRYCGSYSLEEVPHRTGSLSRIGLWVHDCLTEDFDHQVSLNRQHLEEGISISYDFGMAFSNHYFPPFYAMELGIPDESIVENRVFLLELIRRYAGRAAADEESMVRNLEECYPKTCKPDFCRYLLRNFKTYFATRLYFGRFFEKILAAPPDPERLIEIGDSIGVETGENCDVPSLVERLRCVPRGRLELRGLDLSGVDLRRADLRGADLTGASLAGADLEGADLTGADLAETDLRGANLEGVKMHNG